MIQPLVERRDIPILGKRKRAEDLVKWSLSNPKGKKWVKDLPHGLRLGFVSNGEEPKLYIHFNQQRLWKFLDSLGEQERFFTISYGIQVEHHQQRTRVRLLGAGKTSLTLWDTQENAFSRQHAKRDPKDDINWMLALVKFSQQGPLVYGQAESMADLQEATAVAIINLDKLPQPVAASKVLTVAKHGLGQEAKNFLVRDALMNVLLAQEAHTKGGRGVSG